jgi:hypothetical protein
MKVQWTSQWRLRCTSCDETTALASTGGNRVTTASMHKTTVAWCRTCCRPRLMAVEPAPRSREAEAKA